MSIVNSSPTHAKSHIALTTLLLLCLSACKSVAPSTTAISPANTTLSKARIAQIIASPDRSAADKANDVRREPALTLAFIGVRPGAIALDLSAGGGYTTELLARAVGSTGRVYGQSAPKNLSNQQKNGVVPEGNATPAITRNTERTAPQPRRSSPEALAERAKNPTVSNIIPVVRSFEDPVPDEVKQNGLDIVTLMFNYHDIGNTNVNRTTMNRAVFSALKPGGIYVIADHSGLPSTGISQSGTLHRIEEHFLREEIESVGFQFVAQGNFLRNPADPRDKNTPEPPQPKDEFFLKFVKP